MLYPVTILDNFFEEPDKIVDLALNTEYSEITDGRWPGVRSKNLSEINISLFNYIHRKLFYNFFENLPHYWESNTTFSIIKPFHQDKYHLKNRGWIHHDSNCYIGGLIYLNKNPEEDTGTSIFRAKDGFFFQESAHTQVKEKFYQGQDISDDVYEEAYKAVHEKYEESIKVNNVYNRMILFDGNTHHAAQTYGSSDRLTINFFIHNIMGAAQPYIRDS